MSVSIGERILFALSRSPDAPDLIPPDPWDGDNALDFLRREFPDLDALVHDRRVLDYGSGRGAQALALVQAGAARATGIELDTRLRADAEARVAAASLAARVEFREQIAPDDVGAYDVVISQNAMEHFRDPASCLREMRSVLKPDGLLLLTFGPPWFAPYGSHMHFFTRLPWVNLLFAESAVMRVRSRYRSDGAMRYEAAGLNRMSLAKLERLLAGAGLLVRRRRDHCVKGLPLAGLPGLRELLVNQVSLVLAVAPDPTDPA